MSTVIHPNENKGRDGGLPAVPGSPVVALRFAEGEQYHYTDHDVYPSERRYSRFHHLQYQTADGQWHRAPTVWLGKFESEYDPENS